MNAGPVHALAYSATPGTYILTGSSDRSIRLYNPSTTLPVSSTSSISPNVTDRHHRPQRQPLPPAQGRLIATYTAHSYSVLSLCVSSDNSHFASAGGDRSILLWDVAAGATSSTPLRRIGGSFGHGGRIHAVAFSGEGDSLLVSAGYDATVRIWDLKSHSPKPIQVLEEARDAVQGLSVRGTEIVTGSVDGRVRRYDIRKGIVTTDVVGAPVTAVDISRDGQTLLVSSLATKERDAAVRLFDRADGTCLRSYKAPGRKNSELRLQAILGGREKWVIAGDEQDWGSDAALAQSGVTPSSMGTSTANSNSGYSEGRLWAWDLLTGNVINTLRIPAPMDVTGRQKKVIGSDGKEKKMPVNVVTCVAWKESGWGDTFAVGGTSGVVTVFGKLSERSNDNNGARFSS